MFSKLRFLGRDLKRQVATYAYVLRDPRTPRKAKVLLGLALAYAVWPVDLIPDWIPLSGQLDDAIVVPALIAFALWFVPKDVLSEAKARAARPDAPSA
jgi:uncharacterized membrane protein YkvA (DUF1232 family)